MHCLILKIFLARIKAIRIVAPTRAAVQTVSTHFVRAVECSGSSKQAGNRLLDGGDGR
ncbi:hypothetical protein D3C71_2031900 [compost metagenome]